MGWGVSRFGRPAGDSWVHGQYLPDPDEAARELAGPLGSLVSGPASLPEISQYTVELEGIETLFERLHDLYAADAADEYAPTFLHRLLVELPSRLRAKGYPADPKRRFVVFSAAFDDMLERAFRTAEQPYHLFAYHCYTDEEGVTQDACFYHHPPTGDEPVEVRNATEYNGLAGDDYPAIVKLCGQQISPQPESIVVTEDQFIEYLFPKREIGLLLPKTLLDSIKGHSYLFVGYELRPWYLRLLLQRMCLNKQSLISKGWVVAPKLAPIEERFWHGAKIQPLAAPPEALIAYVDGWLKRL